ncbi:patatin-like phospholipase family protein [Sphingomonas psychrotolerans]|uniref:Patatin-like phospholipase family protein n=1 Tax=Sphingomonas psychrotolerans TaxID=1327635 RepID=A0ABU3NAJ8_9SPHN|nr:patatin-like phospholipase family protein [Sphingomonas psychrotolerans]MDT8760817.1 patatin-like phospholipase family protein [Sphingomonas psychrotolerans]
MTSIPPRPDMPFALVLSGGNALGAYHGGAYQALHEANWLPDWIAGASAGAVNGALIGGNPVERRIERLQAFWRPADGESAQVPVAFEEARRTGAAALTMAMGQPGLFAPRSIYGPWWNPLGNPEPASLYDASPLRETLERLVDFTLLNQGQPRFSATAVDIETGEDIVFDTRTHALGPEHVRASSALLPAFSPVEIDGRLLGDAGISVNLPLDVVLREPGDGPLLCIAVDLLPLHGARPATLGETVLRMQDLLFATQSRRAIAAWQAIFDARTRAGDTRPITLLHIAYSDHQREVSGKAFDFSPRSAGMRWQAGYDDMIAALAAVGSRLSEPKGPGMRVFSGSEQDGQVRYDLVHHAIGPRSG